MQQLVGRLTRLDPQASEGLRVISYFDALVAGRVGVDGLLRGAAILSGAVAGADLEGKISRHNPDGERLGADAGAERSLERTGSGWTVWLERDGAAHVNDEMVVERLALAVELAVARHRPDTGLDIIIDESRRPDERAAALARLRLPRGRIRFIATDVGEVPPNRSSTTVATKYGMLRATLDTAGDLGALGRAGVGTWEDADRVFLSWSAAIVAFRLTDPSVPVVDASDLGAMLLLARAYDPSSPHPDVLALARLDARSARILRVLVEADSIRAAAAQLGMHHSSLQARHDALTESLGYDARTITGRLRYGTAELLRRLTDPSALPTDQAVRTG